MYFPLLAIVVFELVLASLCRGERRDQFRPATYTVGASSRRKSVADMTCAFVDQPLNHFHLPRGGVPTFRQRYCVDNQYVLDPTNATVFLYVGNESPLEQYINNTGLMWELAQEFNAQVVFIEHRYEGKSLPSPAIPNCMAYSSSVQALADYAAFVETHLFSQSSTTFKVVTRPVIAFGGSYGGMLSSWMRMKYPNLIAGAIAASAPIWGFPLNVPSKIDSASRVVQRGLERPYPPTDESQRDADNHCASNLLAAWPLIQHLARGGSVGRSFLTRSFRLCSPLQEGDEHALLDWAQSPWFDLAEGSFPYPSSYIPFALTHNDRATLPAWPLQSACWKQSRLYKDLGVRFTGNLTDVRYEIAYAESGLVLEVDWDNVTSKSSMPLSVDVMSSLSPLLSNVRDAVSIWYNITNDTMCYDLAPAPNNYGTSPIVQTARNKRSLSLSSAFNKHYDVADRSKNATEDCHVKMKDYGSWGALCCNENMNLIITEARGMGHDFHWPPSHPRGTQTHADVIRSTTSMSNQTDPFCRDPDGHYGFPQDPPDPWSRWLDTVYGGLQIQSHSNIIFSNGLLDPWSAAGVYATDPVDHNIKLTSSHEIIIPGLYLQQMNNGDLIALVMEYGGHHTDLMYSSSQDPPSITRAREIEKEYIAKWVQAHWQREKTARA